MKKIHLKIFLSACIVLIISLLVQSCANELVAVEQTENTKPVIYGFLNLSDSVTYIRVEKTFADATRQPSEVAQIPDSIYFKNVNVSLVRGTQRFNLQKTDGNTEGYPRADGFFARAPNTLYKIKTSDLGLKTNDLWRIEVQNPTESKVLATSQARVIGGFDLTAPAPTVTTLNLRYDNTFTISVQTEDTVARAFDVNVILKYRETENGKTTEKSSIWRHSIGTLRRLEANGRPSLVQTFSRRGQDFFQHLGETLPKNTSLTRQFVGIDLEILAVGESLFDFINFGKATSGITGSQNVPIFTNITGGFGVFSSRNRSIRTNFLLTNAALDLLKTGDLTRDLNFR